MLIQSTRKPRSLPNYEQIEVGRGANSNNLVTDFLSLPVPRPCRVWRGHSTSNRSPAARRGFDAVCCFPATDGPRFLERSIRPFRVAPAAVAFAGCCFGMFGASFPAAHNRSKVKFFSVASSTTLTGRSLHQTLSH